MKYLFISVLLISCDAKDNQQSPTFISSIKSGCDEEYILPRGEKVFTFSSNDHYKYVVTIPMAEEDIEKTYIIRHLDSNQWCLVVKETK